MMHFGDLMDKLRRERGITQGQLGAMVLRSEGAIQRVRSTGEVSASLAKAIFVALMREARILRHEGELLLQLAELDPALYDATVQELNARVRITGTDRAELSLTFSELARLHESFRRLSDRHGTARALTLIESMELTATATPATTPHPTRRPTPTPASTSPPQTTTVRYPPVNKGTHTEQIIVDYETKQPTPKPKPPKKRTGS